MFDICSRGSILCKIFPIEFDSYPSVIVEDNLKCYFYKSVKYFLRGKTLNSSSPYDNHIPPFFPASKKHLFCSRCFSISLLEFSKSAVTSFVGTMAKGQSFESHDLVLALANETIENNSKNQKATN